MNLAQNETVSPDALTVVKHAVNRTGIIWKLTTLTHTGNRKYFF